MRQKAEAHFAATDTPNNVLTRTTYYVLYHPVRMAIKTYFVFGVITNNRRIMNQLYRLIQEAQTATS